LTNHLRLTGQDLQKLGIAQIDKRIKDELEKVKESLEEEKSD